MNTILIVPEIVALILAVLLTSFGQVLYKLYAIQKRFTYWIASIASFCLVPFFNYLALLGLPLDVVYMATSVTIVLVVYLGRVILKEEINVFRLAGILLIVLGIVIYNS